MSRVHLITDRWFRGWGIVTLLALAVTALSLLSGRGDWRLPFLLAHLAALVALLPLGMVLVGQALSRGYREAGSPLGALAAVAQRHTVVLVLLAIAAVTIAVSLANFDGGVRAVRTTANLTTVAIIVVLVTRYLRAARNPSA